MWTIIWCSQQCGRWRSATFRRYRAALLWAVERLAEAGRLDLAEVKRCLDALKCAPDPRPARAAPQTSARKRHGVTLNEIEILVGALSNARTETHRLLRGLLVYGVHFGLRPTEFVHATVRDRQLLVRCAKATNGRAVGASRALLLNGFGPRELRTLAAFFVLLRKAAAAAPSCSAFFDRLRQALRRLCLAHDIEPICLYTLRHQGIANAKVHLGRRALAAYAGHASQQTASRGYARARAGWRTELRCGPDPDTVIAVRPLPQRRFGGAEASPEPSPLARAFTDEPPPLGLGLEGESPRPPEAAGIPMRAEVPEGDEPMADDPRPYGM
jgi:integrase